jgi:NAD(P)-dependent dehydrogenase (short-subunit alcohol dehydrogenase family)
MTIDQEGLASTRPGAVGETRGDGSGRIVVVTGASSGIGLATAVAFAEAGDRVVATVRGSSRRTALDAALAVAGVEVDLLELDVTQAEAAEAAVATVADRYGRIDVLVNNAGRGYTATLEELTVENFRQSMEVNFFGVARLTKAVLPRMRGAGRGHLIAVTSMGGAIGQPFNDAYCAAKFAVEGLYESLNPVAARFGVHVSIVEPGPVATEFRAHSWRGPAGSDSSGDSGDSADEELAELKSRYLAVTSAGFQRAQSPEDVAAVIVGVTREEAPVLRYQSSNFMRRVIGRKLNDLTGEAVIGLTSAWLDGPEAVGS